MCVCAGTSKRKGGAIDPTYRGHPDYFRSTFLTRGAVVDFRCSLDDWTDLMQCQGNLDLDYIQTCHKDTDCVVLRKEGGGGGLALQ